MKVIIAGSRGITGWWRVAEAIAASKFDITEVISGGARGVDTLAMYWARSKKKPLTVFMADWKGLGKSAGFRRNEQMAQYADALIAVWDGKSRGTKHMIETMRKLGKPYEVVLVPDDITVHKQHRIAGGR